MFERFFADPEQAHLPPLRRGDGAQLRCTYACWSAAARSASTSSQPVDLAVPLDFNGPQPRHFGAPPRDARTPSRSPGFNGAVARGASCNCEVITLIPHCNGTHTECVGHLTREAVDAYRAAPAGLIPALLVSVAPEPAGAAREASEPAARGYMTG